jgi:hypothetical protein
VDLKLRQSAPPGNPNLNKPWFMRPAGLFENATVRRTGRTSIENALRPQDTVIDLFDSLHLSLAQETRDYVRATREQFIAAHEVTRMGVGCGMNPIATGDSQFDCQHNRSLERNKQRPTRLLVATRNDNRTASSCPQRFGLGTEPRGSR